MGSGGGDVGKVEVETAGGGLKDERQKERGGRREKLAAHSRTTLLFLNTTTTCLVFTYQSLFHVHHTLYIKLFNRSSCQRVHFVSSVFICLISLKTDQQSIKHPSHQSVFDYIPFIKIPTVLTKTRGEIICV